MSLSDCPPSFKLVKLGNPDAERDALNAGIQAMLRCMEANSIPDPTGHAGEYLTTDGSAFSWAPAGGGSGVIVRTIQFDIALGAGVSLSSGNKQRVYPGLPYGLALYAWRARSQDASGSIEFDVRRRNDDTAPTGSDSICGAGNEPYLSAEWGRLQTDLSAWTNTTLAAGDRVAVNVNYSTIVGLRDATLLLYGVQL